MKDLTLSPEQQAKFDEYKEWAEGVGARIARRQGAYRDPALVKNYALLGLAQACKVEKVGHPFDRIASTRIFSEVIQCVRDNAVFRRSEFNRRKGKDSLPAVLFGADERLMIVRHPVNPEPLPGEMLEMREEIAKLCLYLSKDELTVIRGSFFEHKMLHEIGDEMGLSESRVCQLRQSALERMREAANNETI